MSAANGLFDHFGWISRTGIKGGRLGLLQPFLWAVFFFLFLLLAYLGFAPD
jgi:hypothetical protein